MLSRRRESFLQGEGEGTGDEREEGEKKLCMRLELSYDYMSKHIRIKKVIYHRLSSNTHFRLRFFLPLLGSFTFMMSLLP